MRQLTAPAAGPDTTESLDRLCSLAAGPVCVAVSGGGDSMALLRLAADWASQRRRAVLALTVDHRLRPEAAEEARFVAGTARQLGIPHQTLTWQAPVAGQEKARRARHDLLAQAAAGAGSGLILTAHTEDDQAETFLIRARAGSGWYGLAGIQPVSLSPALGQGMPVLLARPLLATSRAALRQMLETLGQTWIEDPSNENPAFERVRVRRRLAGAPGMKARILSCQRKLQLLRKLQDRSLARWLDAHVTAAPGGALVADAPLPAGDQGQRALSVLIALAACRSTPLRAEAVARLANRLAPEKAFRRATLGGALISRNAGKIRIVAEHAQPGELVNAIPQRLTALGTAYSGGM